MPSSTTHYRDASGKPKKTTRTVRCGNCREYGHNKLRCGFQPARDFDIVFVDGKPMKVMNSISCNACDRVGHNASACPYILRCQSCHEKGHKTSDCPVPCGLCNVPGHRASSCPKLCDSSTGQRLSCGEKGHVASACPSQIPIPATESLCDICREAGHCTRDCVTCGSCGEVGHVEADCPDSDSCSLDTSVASVACNNHSDFHEDIETEQVTLFLSLGLICTFNKKIYKSLKKKIPGIKSQSTFERFIRLLINEPMKMGTAVAAEIEQWRSRATAEFFDKSLEIIRSRRALKWWQKTLRDRGVEATLEEVESMIIDDGMYDYLEDQLKEAGYHMYPPAGDQFWVNEIEKLHPFYVDQLKFYMKKKPRQVEALMMIRDVLLSLV